jgi:hypothetical protein
MTRSLFLVLPALLALTACGTPQEQCINSVAGNLHTIDGLILQTQGNLQRGFGYTQEVRSIPRYEDCTPRATSSNPNPRGEMCLVDSVQTFQRPVAIDLAAEQKKLDQLVAKRAQIARQVAPAVAACQAQYPE